MPLSTLRKLWLVVSIALLIFSIEVMVATQGWPEILSIDNFIEVGLPDNTAEAVSAYWGILFLSVLLIAGMWLLVVHAQQAGMQDTFRWPGRLLDVEPRSPIGRAYNLFTVLVFALFPLYTLGHAVRVFLDRIVLCHSDNGNWSEIALGWRALWLVPDTLSWSSFATDDLLRWSEGCSGDEIAASMTAFPIIVPLLIAALLLFVLVMTARAFWRLLS